MSVEERVLIALHFYASGSFYQAFGDSIGVDTSTVSWVVKAVSVTLNSLVNQFVCFPRNDQISQSKCKFLLLGNMPKTIGVIDCTHMYTSPP